MRSFEKRCRLATGKSKRSTTPLRRCCAAVDCRSSGPSRADAVREGNQENLMPINGLLSQKRKSA
ncbi:hypothetical protein NE850_25495 [Paraburkholderia sp. USG1]|nr:hypothetical protein [Paraburkholderia sp. USG1]